MLLNLYRMEDGDPEHVSSRSFLQFQAESALPSLKDKLLLLEREKEEIVIDSEKQVQELYELYQQVQEQQEELRTYVMSPVHSLPYLQPGRLVCLVGKQDDELEAMHRSKRKLQETWGVIINFERKNKASVVSNSLQETKAAYDPSSYNVDVLVHCIVDAKSEGW